MNAESCRNDLNIQEALLQYLSFLADKRSDADKLKNAKNNHQDAGQHPHIQHGYIGHPRGENQDQNIGVHCSELFKLIFLWGPSLYIFRNNQ